MRVLNEEIFKDAQAFAARWGFLTRDIFYKFICQMRPSQQFRYWNFLLKKRLFIRSGSNPSVLFLSRQSRRQLGQSARPSRFHSFINHDAIVADVALTLGQFNLISRYWLEDDLMRNPLDAHQILGGGRIYRLPDFVFDLKTRKSVLRCAIEIEKTCKTKSRYDKIALAYSDYRRINLVLFGCVNKATESMIRRSFSCQTLRDLGTVPGTFLISEFGEHGLATRLRFNEKELPLQNMLHDLTGGPVQNIISKGNLKGMAIPFRNAILGDAS